MPVRLQTIYRASIVSAKMDSRQKHAGMTVTGTAAIGCLICYPQAEVVFGYYFSDPKALTPTISQRADRVPHFLLDTGKLKKKQENSCVTGAS